MKLKIILFLVLLFCSVGLSSATDYYVSTSGNNALDGLNITNAWQNVSYGVTQLTAGDTLYLIDGTWYSENIVFSNSGNITHPITITSYNGTTILDGVDKTIPNKFGMYMYESDVHDIIITNITITNYDYLIYIRNSENITTTNITATHSGSQSIYIIDSNDIIIQDSLISDIGTGITGNGIFIQSAKTDCYNIDILNNCIRNDTAHNLIDLFNYNVTGDCGVRDINIIDNEIYNTTYQALFQHLGNNVNSRQFINNVNFSNNIVHDCKLGIKIDYLNDSTISNNVIYGNEIYGITNVNSGTFEADNVTITNNSVYSIQIPDGTVYINSNGTQIFDANNISWYTSRINGTLHVTDSTLNTYTIQSSNGGNILNHFTDGAYFTETGLNSTYFYNSGSKYSTTGDETVSIQKYNITLMPTTGYLKNIIMNNYDLSTENYNITINSSIAENPTWINITVANASNTYNISRDGVYYDSVISSPDSITKYYYNVTGDEWSEHTFDITWSSTDGWIAGDAQYIGYECNTYTSGNITQKSIIPFGATSLQNIFSMVII